MVDTNAFQTQDEMVPVSSLFARIAPADLIQILDMLPDAMVMVNLEGRITMANQQAVVLFGYPRQELLGQSLELLLPERFREAHLTYRSHYTAAPRSRPMGVGLPLFGRHQDGTEIPVDISLRPLQLDDGLQVIAAIRDVTQQRRIERERAQQAQHLRLQGELIHRAHDAILVCDPISRILLWNSGAERLYGWTAQEALGRITHTLLKTRFPVPRATLEEQLEREGIWEGELTHTCRDGHTVLVESRQVLVRDQQGRPEAILEINRDVTERRYREQVAQATYAETAAHLTFLQQLLDALPSGIYLVTGTDARLLLANQAAHQLWGARWQEGQPMREFLAQNQVNVTDLQGDPLALETLATLRALQRGERVLYYQEIIHRADGSTRPVLVNAVPLHVRPHFSRLDLSGDQQESATAATTEPLALVVHQDVTVLKESDDLKDEFIGIAAHELRTPLAV
ncbi:MAG: PAS domain S-box protein, partial [Ktedonobacteraceae bacterium]|nr:PAS domain S-box protein [Ktedonobacteraceae bacterium]